jgi:hypothetical protein
MTLGLHDDYWEDKRCIAFGSDKLESPIAKLGPGLGIAFRDQL